ncbi:MAG: DUF3696 domain-containing protein [Devosia sp.]|nr:DUF3696 domain-containing protein [Devosia sp.]
MLRSWTIGNFKSFSGLTELSLAPITILAGANSSGKSTLIQSMLLIKQTMQYAPIHRALGLNGPLLKLGRFDDVINSGSEDNHITIGWEIDQLSSYGSSGVYGPNRVYFSSGSSEVSSASVTAKFTVLPPPRTEGESSQELAGANVELAQLQPVLAWVSCDVRPALSGDPRTASASIILERKISPSAGPATEKMNDYAKDILKYDVKKIDEQSQSDVIKQKPGAKILGAGARHFLPSQVGFRFDRQRYIAQKISERLCSQGLSSSLLYLEQDIEQYALPVSVSDRFLDRIIETRSAPMDLIDRSQPMPFADIISGLKGLPYSVDDLAVRVEGILRNYPRQRQIVRASLAEYREEFEAVIFESQGDTGDIGFEFGFPRVIASVNEQLGAFFQSSIHYLGPLRDEPRPIYPLEALINPKDVGYRGEHTAAVLDLHRETSVRYFSTRDAEKLFSAKAVRGTLHSAVVEWLSYLGVAEAVSTADLGKIGHQLQVSVDRGAESHDLTNVGVGVSQLLPIVVMSLLADSPSCLIFEQPELHLHPKVQARLADFFFSLSLLGKQCILETHSEYLVERFRRRIAEAPGDVLNERVKIFFTEKVKGQTRCREVKLSRYGSVLDWPPDFFDQAQTETESILRAAQKKRNDEKNTGH